MYGREEDSLSRGISPIVKGWSICWKFEKDDGEDLGIDELIIDVLGLLVTNEAELAVICAWLYDKSELDWDMVFGKLETWEALEDNGSRIDLWTIG